MPNYLVRFVQMHESFRIAELKALAKIAGVEIEVLKYDEDVGERIFVSAQIV
jgi:tRNA (guanine10-N2)-methyltransferase